jgi:soluble lytic murein transglycosylase
MPDAMSPAGAAGLMQLMPSTAAYVAQKKVSRQVLFDPQRNVQYGVQYLRFLMDKMHNNPVLVSAAYNAGWGKVEQWLPDKRPIATDIWIETIPYRETRDYVKAVMAYRYIYDTSLNQSTRLFEMLANGVIPPKAQLKESDWQANNTLELVRP